MNRIHLPRLPDVEHTNNFDVTPYKGKAGWFFDVRSYIEMEDGFNIPAKMAIFLCTCGELGTVTKHSITSDGEINNSLLCRMNCGFHEWGILDNWPSDHFKNVDDLFVRKVK